MFLLNSIFFYFLIFLLKFFLRFVYFWERQSVNQGGTERERERGTHRIWSRPQPLSFSVGPYPTNCEIITWAEVRHLTDWATQVPLFYFKFFIYFWESSSGGGAERRTEDLKQGPHWQQQAGCGAWTHEPWDHDLSWSWTFNQLSHPGAPLLNSILKNIFFSASGWLSW